MNDSPEDEREQAESTVRDQQRFRLTGREPWLKLSPDGRLLVRIALYCAIIVLLGFCSVRVLFGGSTTSLNQRLTAVVDTPAGEVRGSSVVKISKTETMGPLVLMEARGVSSKTRGEAVALEVLPGRWLFALLSGDDDGKGNAGQLAYHAVRHGETHNPSDRNYEADMHDLRAQPRNTPVPIPPEAYPLLVTFDDITKPETVREVDPSNLAATFGEGVRLRGMTLEVTREGVTEGQLKGLLGWLGRDPGRRLIPGDGRTTAVPFARKVSYGDFLAAPP